MNTKYKTGDIVVCHTDIAESYGWTRDRLITITGYYYYNQKNHYRVTYNTSTHGGLEDFLPISFLNNNFRRLNKVEKLLYAKI